MMTTAGSSAEAALTAVPLPRSPLPLCLITPQTGAEQCLESNTLGWQEHLQVAIDVVLVGPITRSWLQSDGLPTSANSQAQSRLEVLIQISKL